MIRLTRLAEQERDGLRHREVRLAGAGGPDAEDDVVLLDRVEVALLRDALRDDLPLARRLGAERRK
jgi:hypothetical protein